MVIKPSPLDLLHLPVDAPPKLLFLLTRLLTEIDQVVGVVVKNDS